MNRICLTGRLATNIKSLKGAEDKEYITFTLAVRESKDLTYFFDIVIFNEWTIKIAKEFLSVGLLTGVSGKLHRNNYTDKKDIKRTSYSIVADTIDLLAPKPKPVEETALDIDPSDLPF